MQTMANFFTILLNNQGGAGTISSEIEAVLDVECSDWLRFTSYSYLVATEHDSKALYEAIKPKLRKGDGTIVMEVNIRNRHGHAPTLVAEWIKRHAP